MAFATRRSRSSRPDIIAIHPGEVFVEQSWRWFGPQDVVKLPAIRQAGARGVVTALHEVAYGEVWTIEAIEARKALIAADPSLGLHWNVVESLPLHERIKIGEGDLDPLFDNYRVSMRNLAACGIRTICYNFMPVVDWTRTELYHVLPGGGRALQRARVCRLRLLHAGTAGRRGRLRARRGGAGARLVRQRLRERQGPAALDHHGGASRRLRPLRHSGLEADPGSLSRHHG
jgi:hypothetical protein